jgi:CRISPR system Cascade subunit CasB
MAQPLRPEADNVWKQVGTVIASVVALGDSPGDMASLRRMAADQRDSAQFWKIAVGSFARDRLPPQSELRGWGCFLQALGQLGKLLHRKDQGGLSLGAALASSGYSELRLLKLLRAEDPLLFDEARTAVHFLAQKGVSVNALDLGLLLILHDGEKRSETRDRVAFDYYRQQHRAASANPSSTQES